MISEQAQASCFQCAEYVAKVSDRLNFVVLLLLVIVLLQCVMINALVTCWNKLEHYRHLRGEHEEPDDF